MMKFFVSLMVLVGLTAIAQLIHPVSGWVSFLYIMVGAVWSLIDDILRQVYGD